MKSHAKRTRSELKKKSPARPPVSMVYVEGEVKINYFPPSNSNRYSGVIDLVSPDFPYLYTIASIMGGGDPTGIRCQCRKWVLEEKWTSLAI